MSINRISLDWVAYGIRKCCCTVSSLDGQNLSYLFSFILLEAGYDLSKNSLSLCQTHAGPLDRMSPYLMECHSFYVLQSTANYLCNGTWQSVLWECQGYIRSLFLWDTLLVTAGLICKVKFFYLTPINLNFLSVTTIITYTYWVLTMCAWHYSKNPFMRSNPFSSCGHWMKWDSLSNIN